jgi:hypothetical protein
MSFLLGLGLGTIFVPSLMAPAHFPKWAIYGVVLPFLLLHRKSVVPVPVALILAWAAIQGLWATDGWKWLQNLWTLSVMAMAVAYGTSLTRREWGWLVFGSLTSVVINAGLVIPQLMGWRWIPQAQAPAGLLANKNFLGEFVVIVLAATRVPWLGVIALAVTAKGAVVAWAITTIIHVKQSLRIPIIILGLSAVAGITLASWSTFAQSTIAARLTLWANSIPMVLDNPLGHGGGAYWGLYPKYHDALLNWNVATYTGQIRPDSPHNDIILILVEYGIPGLLFVMFLGYYAFGARRCAPEAANALFAFVLCGLFGFPFKEPATALFAAFALGHLLGLRHGVCGEWVYGRDLVPQGPAGDVARRGGSVVEFRPGGGTLPA